MDSNTQNPPPAISSTPSLTTSPLAPGIKGTTRRRFIRRATTTAVLGILVGHAFRREGRAAENGPYVIEMTSFTFPSNTDEEGVRYVQEQTGSKAEQNSNNWRAELTITVTPLSPTQSGWRCSDDSLHFLYESLDVRVSARCVITKGTTQLADWSTEDISGTLSAIFDPYPFLSGEASEEGYAFAAKTVVEERPGGDVTAQCGLSLSFAGDSGTTILSQTAEPSLNINVYLTGFHRGEPERTVSLDVNTKVTFNAIECE